MADEDDRAPCGTYGGFQTHARNGEEACEPCKLARNEYAREYRRRTGRTVSTLVHIDTACPNCGHHFIT